MSKLKNTFGLPDSLIQTANKIYAESQQVNEKLVGKQHKIDKNKNGKIDKEDFKLLRQSVEVDSSLVSEADKTYPYKSNEIAPFVVQLKSLLNFLSKSKVFKKLMKEKIQIDDFNSLVEFVNLIDEDAILSEAKHSKGKEKPEKNEKEDEEEEEEEEEENDEEKEDEDEEDEMENKHKNKKRK